MLQVSKLLLFIRNETYKNCNDPPQSLFRMGLEICKIYGIVEEYHLFQNCYDAMKYFGMTGSADKPHYVTIMI